MDLHLSYGSTPRRLVKNSQWEGQPAKKLGCDILKKIHQSWNLGIHRMQDLKHQAKVKIRNSSQTIDKLCPSVMSAN